MTHSRKILALGVLLGTATSSVVEAAPTTPRYAYIGAGAGYIRVDSEEFQTESDESAYSIVLGSQAKVLGAEVAYIDFGDSSSSFGTIDARGFSGAISASLPLSESVALYLRGGVLYWHLDFDSNTLGVSDDERNGSSGFYSPGMRFELNDTLALKLEYTRYKIDDTDIDQAGLAANIKF